MDNDDSAVMNGGSGEKPEVKVKIPGSQNFTPEQRLAVRELIDDMKADGYDVSWPMRKTASTGQAVLEAIGLYIAARGSIRVVNRATDDTADYLVDTAQDLLRRGIEWAKAQFQKNRRDEGEPPRTTRVAIYGPDEQIIKWVDVVEDPEESGDDEGRQA